MKKKYKLFIILMCGAILLNGCTTETSPRQEQKQKFVTSLEKYCPINLDNNKDWYVATIYFNNMDGKLSKADENILTQVAILQVQCNKPILLISSISDAEYNSIVDNYKAIVAFNLANSRLKSVKQILVKNNVNSSYINSLSCGIFAKRVYENESYYNNTLHNHNIQNHKIKNPKINNNDLAKANQFVEVIFLNTKNNTHYDDCFVNNIDGR